MTVPVGSFYAIHQQRITEVLGKSIEMFMPALDSVWEESIATNFGTVRADNLGRDWLVIRHFQTGLAGVIRPGGPMRDWTLYGDYGKTPLGPRLYRDAINSVYPDPTKGSNPVPFRLSIPMRSMLTNLMVTEAELQAEVTPAFIGEVIVPKMTGFARHLAQYLCNYFYLSQNDHYSLTSVGQNAASASPDNQTLKLDLTLSNHAVDRFMVGMQVQIYSSNGATLRATSGGDDIFIVVALDELSGCVYLKSQNNQAVNGANFINSLQTGDIVVFAESKGDANTPFSASPYFTGIAGINSWMKFGGSTDNENFLLGVERLGGSGNGNIDVRVHPEFRSLKVDNAGLPLTEHQMRKILRAWHRSKNKYGQTIDTLIASDGVWLAYEAQKISRQYFDRTGRLSRIDKEGSAGQFEFEMDGRRYSGVTSTYVESNTVYGIKRKGNWEIVAPPSIRGEVKDPRQKSWIPFVFVSKVVSGHGHIPIFRVIDGINRVTEGVQMPGHVRMQAIPKQPTGLKIVNVAEDRLYSS